MKARRRRSSAFIVSNCLEPLMKYEARVFGIASETICRLLRPRHTMRQIAAARPSSALLLRQDTCSGHASEFERGEI